MKKIILLAAFGVAGLVSAKNSEEMKPSKEGEKKVVSKTTESKGSENALKMQCSSIGILITCTDEILTDTVCWGEGSGTATYAQAHADHIHNAQLLNEYLCG